MISFVVPEYLPLQEAATAQEQSMQSGPVPAEQIFTAYVPVAQLLYADTVVPEVQVLALVPEQHWVTALLVAVDLPDPFMQSPATADHFALQPFRHWFPLCCASPSAIKPEVHVPAFNPVPVLQTDHPSPEFIAEPGIIISRGGS